MPTDVTALLATVQRFGAALVDSAAITMVDAVKAAAPVSKPTETNDHSGRLRDDLKVLDRTSDGTVEAVAVGSTLPYASFTDEDDTGPHTIRGNPLLRFWWDNGPGGPGVYYYRQVQHPGTTGQKWFASHNAERWDTALQQAAAGIGSFS